MFRKLKNMYQNMPVQARASVWFLFCSFLQKAVSMITTPVFTRLMTAEEYGQYSVFHSWLGIVTIIVGLNLYAGVYQRGLVKFEAERKVFSSSLEGLALTLCVFWLVIYLAFRDFWNHLFSFTTVQMLAMFVMVWTTAVFSFWAAEQRVTYQYSLLVIVTVILMAVEPAVGIFFVWHSEDKVTARIIGIAAVQLIGYAWMFFAQMRAGKKFFSAKYWKHALCFNIPLVPHYLSQTVLNSADRIMIQRMINAESAGIYSLAYSLSHIMKLFNIALMDVLSPWIYTKIRDKKISDIAPIAYISLAIIASANILLIAFAPEAVALFAPEEYYDAIWCIPPAAMSVYFIFCYDLFAKFEFFYEKTKMIAAATMAGAAVNIALNYVCILKFGYMAAAYTTLVCYMLYAVFHFFAMLRVCKHELDGEYPYDVKKLIMITLMFEGAGFLYLFTYFHAVLRYSLTAGLLAGAFINRKKLWKAVKKIYNCSEQV